MKKLFLIVSVCALALSHSESFAEQKGFTKYSECPILFEIRDWKMSRTLDKREYWGRHESWFGSDGWISESGSSFDFNPTREKSYNITNNPQNTSVLTYIGPWQKVTLTKGSLWNEEKTETEIRLIASQNKQYIETHFETKDDLNSKIPEQDFVLLEPAFERIPVCYIKWVEKYGYDAVADCHLNPWRHFGGEVLKCSGKIINAYTKEVIYDPTKKEEKSVQNKEVKE